MIATKYAPKIPYSLQIAPFVKSLLCVGIFSIFLKSSKKNDGPEHQLTIHGTISVLHPVLIEEQVNNSKHFFYFYLIRH